MELSVLIPTRARPRLLARCLDHLARQQDAPPFEVIVAIDGPEDYGEAELERRAASHPYPLRALRSRGRGPAAALNEALRAARGRLALLIGDDIFAAPQLLARHVARHRTLEDRRVAVQGKVSWHPEILPDPFLDWEKRRGVLFAFERMPEHGFVPARFLYTCNVSLDREWLEELGGFDGSLPSWIDTVFAYEAEKRGLRLYYDPDAFAHHRDPWTLERLCRRRYEKGTLAAELLARDPGFASHVAIPRPGLRRTLLYAASRGVRTWAERRGFRALVDWCWIHEVNHHFVRGLRDGSRSPRRE